jgi:carbon monoxide dehydrogenase subunit G
MGKTTFSGKSDINTSVQQMVTFLQDANNHEQLMPPNIINWKSTSEECSFELKNMAKLTMAIQDKMDNGVRIVPKGKAPISIELEWLVTDTEVTLNLHTELNPFLKMMAQKPLQELVDYQCAKLSNLTID